MGEPADLKTQASPPRRNRRFWRSHPRLTAFVLCLFLAFLGLNFVAYRHAYAMLHFVSGGLKTPKPEALSFGQKVGVLLTGVTVPRPVNESTPAAKGLPFETYRFPAADGELEAWHIPSPNAKGMILLFHGYAACKSALLPEATAFRQLGFGTLLVDFRGSGGSSGNDTTIGVREAEDAVAAFEFARERWANRPLILYGQSMGSAAILRAIGVHGLSPRAIIIESPFDRLLSTVANRFSVMGLPAFPAAHLLVFWGGIQCGFNGFRHKPVDYARSVHCPTLLLLGDRDLMVTREQADAVYQNLAGEKRFQLLPGVGHGSCLAAAPEEWNTVVSGFLSHLSR